MKTIFDVKPSLLPSVNPLREIFCEDVGDVQVDADVADHNLVVVAVVVVVVAVVAVVVVFVAVVVVAVVAFAEVNI